MKSELTLKLEVVLDLANATVKQAQQFVGARQLRIDAMATHHAAGEALAMSKLLDDKPAPVNNPPAT